MDGERLEARPRPTIVFAGGGTGGHLYPGIAVAERWIEKFPDSRVVFVGTDRPVELQIARTNRLNHVSIPFLPPSRALKAPWAYLRKLKKANQIVDELFRAIRPDIVIGLGGYVSVPTVLRARRLRIPIVLLEQNSIPGRANRFLAKYADHICLTYQESTEHLPRMTPSTVTGNPLRSDVIRLRDHKPGGLAKRVLLITGGSQGARLLNDRLIEFARQQSSVLKGWEIRHQAGSDAEAERVRSAYETAGVLSDVRAFFNSPTELYQDVSLVVTRAGATTLAELEVLQIPALIIPIASSVNNHQLHNANAHVRFSCSQVITEYQVQYSDLFTNALSEALRDATFLNPQNNENRSTQDPDAAEKVVDLVCRLLRSD